MCPYLGPTIRIEKAAIYVVKNFTFNSEHITELESIRYLWRDHNIWIHNGSDYGAEFAADDFQPILNSPTILQCQHLLMDNAHFSFKDYNILCRVKVFILRYKYYKYSEELEIYWQQFLEQPGVKPVFVLLQILQEKINNLLDQLSKALCRNLFCHQI
ncbi:hypothetical protein DdX_04213 [Ditylenchus destructor]|uniref:Uncharacterized protein n=1 Tax=Ditylenchus destructor TaxID=166010 RepID=A0AAD4R7J6_9BILA|nr:hypothetical protein DdX_04213 [Ditylenchus destructor]